MAAKFFSGGGLYINIEIRRCEKKTFFLFKLNNYLSSFKINFIYNNLEILILKRNNRHFYGFLI
jgi:hypothetical protein